MPGPLRITIIGDFNPAFPSHHATTDSIAHASAQLNLTTNVQWVPTTAFDGPEAGEIVDRCDGLWASPGSPYASFDGMLNGIRLARERNWPFVGT